MRPSSDLEFLAVEVWNDVVEYDVGLFEGVSVCQLTMWLLTQGP